MCLIAFAIGATERWPLVIAANRDEFFDRPTRALASWQTANGQTIISGRDLQAGGSWLGLNAAGRIAMLTNVRELPLSAKTPPRSRGDLVMKWLDSDCTDVDALISHIDPADYGGFNLVVGSLKTASWSYLTNRSFIVPETGQIGARSRLCDLRRRDLDPGIYVLGNASLDTPWPKALRLKATLANALQCAEEVELAEKLWNALSDPQKAAARALPDTGLPVELESALSSAFISEVASRDRAAYGTRCSTLLMAQRMQDCTADLSASRWRVKLTERTHGAPHSASSASTSSQTSVCTAV